MRSKSFLILIFIIIGSFFYWGTKGFKNKWRDEFSGPYDLDKKYDKNLYTGFLITIFLILIILPNVLKYLYTQ